MTDYAVVASSTDYGATLTVPSYSIVSPGSVGGFDLLRVGNTSMMGGTGQGYKATAIGGAYSTLGADGATSGSQPTLMQYAWRKWGTTTTTNFSLTSPDYLLGALALVSSHCLWIVTGSGGRTGITPTGVTSIPGNNCSTTFYGTRMAIIGSVSGTLHLFTSINIGSGNTWSDRGALGSTARWLRFRRIGGAGKEIYIADGTVIKYTKDTGATLVSKTTPATTDILCVEAWG